MASALSCCSVDFEIFVKTYDNVGVVQVIQVLGFHDTPLNTLLVVKKFVAALPPCKNLVKNASNWLVWLLGNAQWLCPPAWMNPWKSATPSACQTV